MNPRPLSQGAKATPNPIPIPKVSAVFTRYTSPSMDCYKHFYGSCTVRSSGVSYIRKGRWSSVTPGSPGGGFFPPSPALPIEDFFIGFNYLEVTLDVISIDYEDVAAYVWFNMEPSDVKSDELPNVKQEDFFGPPASVTQSDFFS